MHVGAEVAQRHQRLAAGVFDFDAGGGRLVRDEHFVFGFLAEVNHGRRLQVELADAAAALHRDPAAGAGVLERALGPGLERQLLGAEQLLAVDRAVDDPAVGVALAAACRRRRSAPGSCAL